MALERSLQQGSLVLLGLGTTIGAGIYALTGVIAGRAGMLAPAAFLLAALLAAFSALSFAELCSRFPRAGGEAVYVREGFGLAWLATAVGVLVTLAGIVSAATVSVAFIGYLGDWIEVPRAATLAFLVFAIGLIAAWGVRESVWAAGALTLVEIGGLLLIVSMAGEAWSTLPSRAPELWPGLDLGAWGAAGGAAILAFYAFLGFEDMVNVAEEVQEVRRTLPRAIVWVLLVTALLYAMTSTAAVLVVPPGELARSEAPLTLVFERSGGSPALLSGIALFAMLNGALIQVIKASRVLYGLASMGSLPRVLGFVHPRTRTPLAATGLATLLAAALGIAFPLEELAALTSGITLVTFALANAALLLVKRRGPAPDGIVQVPALVPALGCLVSASLVVAEIARRLA